MTQRSSFKPLGGRLSRRHFLASVGRRRRRPRGGRPRAFAASADTLKIGFISPRTGPLAGFGETDGYVLELARKALADGLDDRRQDLRGRDPRPGQPVDPSRAGQVAKDLINSDKIDLMLAISTPETINPVADACEAAGVPCISTVVPWEAWYFGRGAKPGAAVAVQVDLSLRLRRRQFSKAYISQWNADRRPTRRSACMCPNDADGNAIRDAPRARCSRRRASRSSIRAPTRTARPTTRPRSRSSRRRSARSSTRFPIPPDFAAFWRQAAQQGYTKMVKIAQIAKTGLFPSQVDGARQSRLQPRERRLLAQGLPLQVVAHGRQRRGARRRLREGDAASSGTSSSARRSRCSTSASRR